MQNFNLGASDDRFKSFIHSTQGINYGFNSSIRDISVSPLNNSINNHSLLSKRKGSLQSDDGYVNEMDCNEDFNPNFVNNSPIKNQLTMDSNINNAYWNKQKFNDRNMPTPPPEMVLQRLNNNLDGQQSKLSHSLNKDDNYLRYDFQDDKKWDKTILNNYNEDFNSFESCKTYDLNDLDNISSNNSIPTLIVSSSVPNEYLDTFKPVPLNNSILPSLKVDTRKVHHLRAGSCPNLNQIDFNYNKNNKINDKNDKNGLLTPKSPDNNRRSSFSSFTSFSKQNSGESNKLSLSKLCSKMVQSLIGSKGGNGNNNNDNNDNNNNNINSNKKRSLSLGVQNKSLLNSDNLPNNNNNNNLKSNSPTSSLLKSACIFGDIGLAEFAIQNTAINSNSSIIKNEKNNFNNIFKQHGVDESPTPLQLACYYGHFQLVKYLVEKYNLDVNELSRTVDNTVVKSKPMKSHNRSRSYDVSALFKKKNAIDTTKDMKISEDDINLTPLSSVSITNKIKKSHSLVSLFKSQTITSDCNVCESPMNSFVDQPFGVINNSKSMFYSPKPSMESLSDYYKQGSFNDTNFNTNEENEDFYLNHSFPSTPPSSLADAYENSGTSTYITVTPPSPSVLSNGCKTCHSKASKTARDNANEISPIKLMEKKFCNFIADASVLGSKLYAIVEDNKDDNSILSEDDDENIMKIDKELDTSMTTKVVAEQCSSLKQRREMTIELLNDPKYNKPTLLKGKTALHFTVSGMAMLHSEEVVASAELLKNKNTVLPNSFGLKIPNFESLENKHFEIIKFLLEHNANPCIRDLSNAKPVDYLQSFVL